MKPGRTPVLLLMALLLPAGIAFAQRGSVPEEQKGSNVPELAGAIRVEGPTLVDGKLPRPFIDYSIDLTSVRRTMTLFFSGLLVVSTTHHDNTFTKKILIPPGAVASYEEFVSHEKFAALPPTGQLASPTQAVETIRVYSRDGTFSERSYDANLRLASDLEVFRGLMKDLMRVISEDQDVSNPMIGYEPLVGDELLTEDFVTYRILRVDLEAGIVEVYGVDDPIRMFVVRSDLETRFIGYKRAPAEE